jgi:hypothetical protein
MELFNNRRQLNQEQEILVKDILRSIKIERKKLVQLFLTRSVGVGKKFTSKEIF